MTLCLSLPINCAIKGEQQRGTNYCQGRSINDGIYLTIHLFISLSLSVIMRDS